MRKRNLFLLATLFFVCSVQGQYKFSKGDIDLNLGISLLSGMFPGSDIDVSIPPLFANVDYALTEGYGPGVIGVGGMLGFSTFKEEYELANIPYGYKYTSIFLGARTTYHIEFIDKLDTYGGFSLFYRIMDNKPISDLFDAEPRKSNVGFALVVGSKYYITDTFAFFAEFGVGPSFITTGLSFRL